MFTRVLVPRDLVTRDKGERNGEPRRIRLSRKSLSFDRFEDAGKCSLRHRVNETNNTSAACTYVRMHACTHALTHVLSLSSRIALQITRTIVSREFQRIVPSRYVELCMRNRLFWNLVRV